MKKMYLFGVVIFAVFLSGCVGFVELEEMKFKSSGVSSGILNLKHIEPQNIAYLNMEANLLEGLFDESSPEYGYIYLDYEAKHSEGWMSWWAASVVVIPLYLLGFPVNDADIELKAYVYIYDSNGNLIKSYLKEDSFYQASGLYYGWSTTGRAGRRLSKMFKEIFKTAAKQQRLINAALIEAGPITKEKEAAAIKKINGKGDNGKGDNRSSSTSTSSTTYSYSNSSSSSDSSSVADSIRGIADTLTQSVESVNKQVQDNLRNQKCGSCRGNGSCSNCGGTGKYLGSNCFSCSGSGVCKRCNGTGKQYTF